jgi:hypothetical protein
MPSDYNEDRAHEMGFVPEDEDLMSAKEFEAMLRDRKPPLTADDIALGVELGRSKNIYQGPLRKEPHVYVPWWAGVLFLAIFVGGVCGLLWMLS